MKVLTSHMMNTGDGYMFWKIVREALWRLQHSGESAWIKLSEAGFLGKWLLHLCCYRQHCHETLIPDYLSEEDGMELWPRQHRRRKIIPPNWSLFMGKGGSGKTTSAIFTAQVILLSISSLFSHFEFLGFLQEK